MDILTLTRSDISFDNAAFKAEFHQRVTDLFNHAISIFISTVGDIVATHQDTGMSLASLFPTARKVGAPMPSLSPKVPLRKGITYMGGTYNPSGFRAAHVGEYLGTKASSISYVPQYRFRFNITVFQHWINEFGYGPANITFDSVERGMEAMTAYIRTNIRDTVPRFNKYLKIVRK